MRKITAMIKGLFSKGDAAEVYTDPDIEALKVSGTKSYIEVEYKGQIARFGGDLCIDGFAAIASSVSWVKHVGPLRDGEVHEMMWATAQKYHKQKKGNYIRFYDDDDNIIEFE